MAMKASAQKKPGKAESGSNWDMRKRYELVTVKCEFCGETFNTSKAYQDHARQDHPDQVTAVNWVIFDFFRFECFHISYETKTGSA